LAQTRTLIAYQQAVDNFPLDDRREDRDILRFSQQVDQPLKGVEERQRDLAGRHSPAGLLRTRLGKMAVHHQL
jgi:hypothetical protein